jgi:general secretion pathway protein D
MKSYTNTSKNILCLSVCIYLFLFTGSLMAQSATTSGNAAESPNTNKEVERFVSIDFNDVDINVFIKFISELTGKNFVVDKRVKGKVTIISPTKISVKEAYKVFESVLEVNGYATVKTDKIIKIIPAPDARSKNIETRFKDELTSPEDKIVTQIIPLTYADSDEIKRLFAPMISKSSVILSYPPTNMLIITDVYSNITRLVRILKLIDITGIGQEISVIPIEFSDATKLVKILSSIFKTTVKTKKKDPDKVVTFVADERTNTIVLLASENDTVRIKKLVKLLDREVPRGKEKIRVYYLENATAEDLAKVLQELPAKKQSPAKGKKQAPLISGDVIIKADKATNSLIIMAEKDDYLVIEEIIKKLDIPRAMVYIECLIMEVNVNKEFNLGTEWQAGGKTDYDGQSKTGFFGGGFSGGGESNYSNIKGMTGTGSLPSGFSLGVFGEFVEIGGIKFPNLAAVIQAHKKDKDVHILSTPQILTTDNEEASITVGKNIPYVTRQDTTTDDRSYSNYEYKDVGITLKITPQISKDRMVRLNIAQEVTKVESLGDFQPTTLKRTIDTTVIVKDKNTVVIGGLIDDSFSNIEYMVPCLGNIPVLGWAFKSMTKSNDKTNLFVFLTPHVIKNPAEADMVYKKKKDQIDKIKEGNIKMYKKKER